MKVDDLVEEIRVIRKKGIQTPRLLNSLPVLQQAMTHYWPARDTENLGTYLSDFIDLAAAELAEKDRVGIGRALGIGALGGETSMERRKAFAEHYGLSPETVRRSGALEDQAFIQLAKAILNLLEKSKPTNTSAPGALLSRTETETVLDGPVITSRERARFAISGFVQDLRGQIEALLATNPEEEVLGEVYGQLGLRQDGTEGQLAKQLSHFLLPQEAFDVLMRHLEMVPADLAELLEQNRAAFESVVSCVNRITRVRPLQPDDLEDLEVFLRRWLQSPSFWRTQKAVQQLSSDTGWQPRLNDESISYERITHNLPAPEFDETGLLGREEAIQSVVSLLKKRREPITLLGEGGIGKTALALEVCYRLADDPEPPFEVILWTSLKAEQLTPAGIKELSRTVKDIDGAVEELGHAIDSSIEADVDGLVSALGGRTTLLVIDNLESNLGDDVIELYDSLPSTVTLLFTSRRGLGQIDRPVPVGPLNPESAVQLFRKFALSRGQVQLAEMPDEDLSEKLGQLRHSPLAIRWFVLSVEAGHAPSDALRDQRELLRFCVGNVVDELGEEQRLLLSVFRAFDRPVTFDELAVISDIDPVVLRRGVQDLRQASLIVQTRLPGENGSDALQLSSAAREFLPFALDSDVTEEIIQREADYRKEREKDLSSLAERGRYFDPNVIFQRSPSDAPIALLLRRALREMKSDNPIAAFEVLQQARTINSGYFEVDRIQAFFASKRNEPAQATALYRSALNNCEADDERHWVSYFYAAHLARVGGGLSEAVSMAEQTHKFFGRYDTAHALGRYLYRIGRFDEAERLIRWSLERAPTPEFQLNATTSLVECFRHRSEEEITSLREEDALKHAVDGLRVGLDLHEAGITDDGFIFAIVRMAVVAFKAVAQPELAASTGEFAEAFQRLQSDPRFQDASEWRKIEYAVASLPEDIRSEVAPDLEIPESLMRSQSGERLRGRVKTIGETFGFIEHADYPQNLYFRNTSLIPPTWISDLSKGSLVEFTPHQTANGKDQGLDIVLVSDS